MENLKVAGDEHIRILGKEKKNQNEQI